VRPIGALLPKTGQVRSDGEAVYILWLDPAYDAVRDYARFQALLEENE